MKTRITIKHITLAVGILVALLAAMMFLVNGSLPLESRHAVSLPTFALPKTVPVFIESVVKVFF
ncbi:MAG TPA: hypothetical protein VGD40_25670 [Chryseosolibacter sp.]